MGDELDDLRAVVSEQGLALKGLQQAAADAEKRKKSYHAELLEMLATLLETCLLYTSPSPRDLSTSRMPSSA